MSEDYTYYLIDAIGNIAHGSIDLKDYNDFIASEATRITNIYSRFIHSPYSHPNDKTIYKKAMAIITKCSKLEKSIISLKDLVQSLLNEMGNVNEET